MNPDALAVVADDGTDLSELLEQAASNSPSVEPPRPFYIGFRAPAEELNTEDQWEPDGAPTPAGPPLLPSPPVMLRPGARNLRLTEAELHELTEAAVWKTDQHPRWPKGSGKKAGQFMQVGETFSSGGKKWQIAHIVNGRIYAHEASSKYGAVETKSFDVKKVGDQHEVDAPEIAHVEPKATNVPKGGKDTTAATVPIVDPYVDSASHDASIPVPPESGLSTEQWQRFGKVDQEHFAELMQRFGKHKPGAAKKHIDSVYAAYSTKAQDLVKKAYKQQYGSSSAYSLSMAAGHHSHGVGTSPNDEVAKLREEALALQAEHKAAVQWDLYNRCKAPDVLAVHKSKSWSAAKWNDYAIDGDNAVFSGLSQSWCYRRSFFGNDGIVTPLAIRHVLLSSASAQPVPGESHFPGELEISVPEQLKLDKRSIAVSASGGKHGLSDSQMSWLEGMTNEPASGAVLDQLVDSVKNGTYLPPPPKPAKVVMDGASGKTWVDPPADAASEPGFATAGLPAVGDKVKPSALPAELPWQHHNAAGVPEAKTGEEAGVKEGQYFMGLKGTLYWIGPDPGNASTGYPLRIHKIVDGAFNGENFAYNPDMQGYYLDAHKPVPESPEAEAIDFDASKWVKSTESKFLDQFATGEKFKLNGTSYEVQGKVSGGIKIQDLESGLTGKINGDYKTSWLVSYDGQTTPEAETAAISEPPKLAIGDHVITPNFKGVVTGASEVSGDVEVTPHGGGVGDEKIYSASDVTVAPVQEPAVGMTFPYTKPGGGPDEKVKATITKVKPDGTVQANLKPGKVTIAPDEWAAYGIQAYDPGAHTIGQPAKLRDLSPGVKFHASAGNQTHRPYEVVGQQTVAGKKRTLVRNLDTGEVSQISAHKSYPTLDPKLPDAPQVEGDTAHAQPPTTGPAGVGAPWDPAKFELSDQKAIVLDMAPGTFFQTASGGVVHVDSHDAAGVHLTVVQPSGDSSLPVGYEFIAPADAKDAFEPQPLFQPKGAPGAAPSAQAPQHQEHTVEPASAFDPAKWVEGDAKTKIGDLAPGTVFKTDSKAGPKYYKLSDDGTKSTNLLTGKVYEVKPNYKATPLSKDRGGDGPSVGVVDPQALKAGDLVQLGGNTDTTVEVTSTGDVVMVKPQGALSDKSFPIEHNAGLWQKAKLVKASGAPAPKDAGPAPAPKNGKVEVGELVTATADPNAQPSLQLPAKTGYVKTIRPADGAVQLHGSVGWYKPENVTSHGEHLPPFEGGDYVTVQSWTGAPTHGTFLGYGTAPNGDPVAEVDTTGHGDVLQFPPVDLELGGPGPQGGHLEGTPLASKAVVPTPYEQLKKGAPVTLGQLKAGDKITLGDADGARWAIAEVPTDPEKNVWFYSKHNPGEMIDSGMSTSAPAVFHSHGPGNAGADAADEVPEPPAQPVVVETVDHPDAVTEGGLVPFMEPKGGPYVHSQIGSMPQGTVFEDAAGSVWKVKMTGPTPVISGGAQHFQVDGALRGKDLSQPNAPVIQHVDTAGPLGGEHDSHPEVAAAEADVIPNTNGSSLSSLTLNPGDYFVPGAGPGQGAVHEVQGTSADGWVTSLNVDTGQQMSHSPGHKPLSVSPGAFIPPKPPAPNEDAAPPTTLYSEPTNAGTLKPGDKFAVGPGSTVVWTMGDSGNVTAEGGGTMYVAPSQPVYVQPTAEPEAPAVEMPAAPTADPGTLPAVEGPNGFAPDAPAPVLDPNHSTTSTLDPFMSRKGPQGIYSYPRLSETQVGQLFSDKSGKDYMVVGHGSGKTVYQDVASGQQHSAASSDRVKLTALPPDPGPQLKPVVVDLTAKYGSLENVPQLNLVGHESVFASDGKTKNPRLGHLSYGTIGYDADGHQVVFLGSWLNRALVLDMNTNEARLADAGTRVSLAPA